MKITFYCIPNAIGLKFDNSSERDSFLNQMQPALTRAACERVAMRSLRFHPARMKTNFVLPLETPNGAVAASPAAPLQVPMPEVSDLKTVLETPQAVAKEPDPPAPVPILQPETPVEPPPPAPEPSTKVEGLTTPDPTVERVTPLDPQSGSPLSATDHDPEPIGIHKNSRVYRAWKQRHPTA